MATADGWTYGGYSYKYVNGNPPDEYRCHICRLVARDPQQVTCCYNIYCKSCLDTLKRKGTFGQGFICPTCRSSLEGKYFKDGRVERGIKSLKVYCTNTDSGCQWMGTINDIDTHLNSCTYHLVPCTNECGAMIRRSSLKTHLIDNCRNRSVRCSYCLKEGPYQLITSSSHLRKCPYIQIQCNNKGCHEIIYQCSLASHNETCPKAIISCEYNTVGCTEVMRREEQEKHNEESAILHLQLTKEQLEVTNDQLELTIEQLQVTSEHLQLTDQQLKVAIKTIQSLKAKVQEHKNLLTTSSEVLKLSQFSQRKEGWCSRGFYTSPGGYKVALHVYPNGYGDGKGTHVSCFIYLEAGEYDDLLEWPFQGEVTIELLNQLEDKNHVKVAFHFNKATPYKCKQRVSQGQEGQEWGIHKFLSHTYRLPNNCRFLKDDSLYFRVSVKVTSKTKPWLALT
uniref:RING-type E3 ubiquitin transferase n=3 Tax=Amphimedon queenslandica TaxID=400682 RepID=A0A1X7TA19_AMPQE